MADAVIAVSRETKNDIEHLFKVRSERLHVIYNGIDLEEYKRVDSNAALKRFAINPLEPYVLFVGRITRQKGIIHLVNAISTWILASKWFCARRSGHPGNRGRNENRGLRCAAEALRGDLDRGDGGR